MMKLITVAMLGLVMGGYNLADAELIDRGNDLIYDNELDITWYNYTNTGSEQGLKWSEATSWAASLNVGGVSGWRLPHVLPLNGIEYNYLRHPSLGGYPDGSAERGWNISAPSSAYPGSKASEIAFLYYCELFNISQLDVNGNSQLGYGLLNVGPLTNLKNFTYWTGSEFGVDTNRAYQFDLRLGAEGARNKENLTDKTTFYYAMAVHDGDVASAVPVPGAAWLLGSGLLGLAGLGRRKKAAVA